MSDPDRLLGRLHAATDDVLGRVVRWPRLFAGGFGDRALLDGIVDRLWAYDPARPFAPVKVRWHGPGRPVQPGIVARRGSFLSPSADILPVESRVAEVELVRPSGWRHGVDPLVLLLAATGEEGFAFRRRFGRPLHEIGVATLALENPLYGLRRPHGQTMSAIRTVAEQFAMNTATTEEACALLAWAHAQGHAPLGVSGYSQGGIMAGFAGALSRFPVAVVPRAATTSPKPVFTDMALAHRFAWRELERGFPSREAARAYLIECLEPVNIARFPAPVRTDLAIIIGAKHDRFVPAEGTEALHEHWPGSCAGWTVAT